MVVQLLDGGEIRSQAIDVSLPAARLALKPNAPNPFNPSTTVAFTLDRDGVVELAVFDVSGRLVRTLVGGFRHAGAHEALWDGLDTVGNTAASGVYVFRLRTPSGIRTVKGVLLK